MSDQLFGSPDPLGTGGGVGYTLDSSGEQFFPPDAGGGDVSGNGGGTFLDHLGQFANTIGTNVGRVYSTVNPPRVTRAGPSTLPSSGGAVLSGLGQAGPLILLAVAAFVLIRLLRK